MNRLNITNFNKIINGQHITAHWIEYSNQRILITNYGARVVSWEIEKVDHSIIDIVCGFDTIDRYLAAHEPYHGATIGRVTNRIHQGAFWWKGKHYQVPINNAPHILHGGPLGWHQRIWKITDQTIDSIKMELRVSHLEDGFPGSVLATIAYKLDHKGLSIDLYAISSEGTPINMTHHSFFNLNGEGQGTILDHEVKTVAQNIAPIDESLIPTGELLSTIGTPFDFMQWKAIGRDIHENHPQLDRGRGYDHHFVLPENFSLSTPAISVRNLASKLTLEVFTDLPGFQLYSGNFLNGSDNGKSGNPYTYRTAFCIEPQYAPDAINQEVFQSGEALPDKPYSHVLRYKVVDYWSV